MSGVHIPSDTGGPGGGAATVARPSAAYLRMVEQWALTSDLLGGTKRMREEAYKYLPRHAAETKRNWQTRVAASFLLGYFRRALRNLSSRPFSRPVALSAELPEQLKGMDKDCDLQGHDLTDFSKPAFRDGLRAGLTYILVDMPSAEPEARTLADERPKRPYLVHYPAEAVIAAYSTTDADGREVLYHVRLRETETVLNEADFSERTVERVRVLRPGSWEVWERVLGGPGASEFAKVSEGSFNSLPDEIPLVIWYAGEKRSLTEAELPLGDMAEKNLEHFRSASDQRNGLTVSRFPMLAATGVAPKRQGPAKDKAVAPEGDEDVSVGPRKMLTATKPDAKFYWVEAGGAALEAGRKDLEALEDHMAVLGAELLARHAKYTTATEKDINAAEVMSDLQAMCVTYEDALTKALRLAARMKGVSDAAVLESIKVKVWRQFAGVQASAQDLDALLKARQSGSMPRKLFLDELQRRGVLADDVDTEAAARDAAAEERSKHEEKKELALVGKMTGGEDNGQEPDDQRAQGTNDGGRGDTPPAPAGGRG